MINSFSKTSSSFKAFLLAVGVFFIYSFSMGGDFKTDDRYSILLNPLIQDWSHILDFFKQGYFGDQSYYRPLVYLTYTIEHHLFGGIAFFYNLDNVLIHIVNALLVWKLTDLLIPERKVGFWVALVFAIHPIHWEAVANISGRSVLLCTMFSLMSFYAFIHAFSKERAAWLGASIAGFVLALLSKESAGVLPGVFFFYGIFTRKDLTPWKKVIVYLLPFSALIIGYVFLRQSLGLASIYAWPTMEDHVLGFLTFLRSLMTHVQLMIWPVGLYFDRSQALYYSLDHPEALYVSTLWLLVIVEGWILRRYIKPVDGLCLAWITLELFPVSQIVTAIGASPGYISAADHFLYSASIPFCILLVRGMGRIQDVRFLQTHMSYWSFRVIGIAFLVFFAVMNVQQNLYARDEVAMLERSLEYQPNNARLQNLAGYLAMEDKNLRRAEHHFEQAVAVDPFNPSQRISLGKVLCDQGRVGECLIQYLTIENPGSFSDLLEKNIQYPVSVLKKKMTAGENISQAGWFGWGLYQARQGDGNQAITAMENVLQLNAENVSALMMLASFYEFNGQIDSARSCYLKLMNIDSLPSATINYVIGKLADLRVNHPEAFLTSS